MAEASYRFFPWVRRGLAAALPASAPTEPRARINAKVSVTAQIAADRSLTMLGPGDVLGIDSRLIIRTDPRPGARSVEPNYMASIEFDPPDFPWMFTPQGAAPTDRRLPPWLALLVLDTDLIAEPSVLAGRPLPFITIPAALKAQELPDLDHSWAWAHAQRLADGDTNDADALAKLPDRNVSRLICPRRLRPFGKWMGCLVPTYDVGMLTGLGTPRVLSDDPNAPPPPPPGKAWTIDGDSDVVLPVYWHWTFETGEQGDFEMLAARLKPAIALSDDEGLSPTAKRRGRIYVGSATGSAALADALPTDDAASLVRLDAPLETLDRAISTVDAVAAPFAEAVAEALRPTVAGSDTELTPPLYGTAHVQRAEVDPATMDEDWFAELNLDPRMRLAARVGGDVVRVHQEDLMQSAWEQVGDVIAANAQLDRSRFLALVAQRGVKRHLATLSASRFLAVTSAAHARVAIGDATSAQARIAVTSLPDRSFDLALRRLSGSAGRTSRVLARLGTADRDPLAGRIAAALQKDAEIVDPSVKPSPGLSAEDEVLKPRGTLSDFVLTDRHHRAADEIGRAAEIAPKKILEKTLEAIRTAPETKGFSVRKKGAGIAVGTIDRDRDGLVSFVEGTVREPLFRVATDDDIPDDTLVMMAARIPAGVAPGKTLSAQVRTVDGRRQIGFAPITLDVGEGLSRAERTKRIKRAWREANEARDWRGFEPRGSTGAAGAAVIGVMPAPLVGAEVAGRVKAALETVAVGRPTVNELPLVRADLGSGGGSITSGLRKAIEPRTTFKRRLKAMIHFPDWFGQLEAIEPIRAAPAFTASFATLLAETAPEVFLPREIEIAVDTVVALKVNPRWIAGCMVGVNHEINRELVWRTYPTDGRGTSATRFWDWIDPAQKDVAEIHRWRATTALAKQLEPGAAKERIVIAVRGSLLLRYPNTLIFAWKADGDKLAANGDIRLPLFRTFLPPDISLIGLDLTRDELDDWFIVLQEPVSESRFGLDEPGTLGTSVGSNGANWSDFEKDGWLNMALPQIAASNSASLAQMLLQRPVRVAMAAKQFIPEEG